MTQTQAVAKIRIASGFLSALDKCPDCGDEHDVASQIECRASCKAVSAFCPILTSENKDENRGRYVTRRA
jgi:hypothetical protein